MSGVGKAVRLLAVTALSACLPQAAAQTSPPAAPEAAEAATVLPAVTVNAYRIPVLLESLSYSVDLVTRDELEKRQPLTAAEALQMVPGLHIDRLGGAGGATNVYMRGSEANHTLVLVDGVRVNDPNDLRGGSYDLSSIPASGIERIEVLRGAHSAVFGADAMGGVINIVTSRGRSEPRGSVRAGAGGRGLRQLDASVSGRALLMGASRQLDGADSSGSRRALSSAFASMNLAPASGWTSRLGLHHRQRRSEAHPEASGGMRLAEIRQLDQRESDESLLSLDNEFQLDEGPLWNLRLSRFERDEVSSSPGVASGTGGFLPASDTSSRLTREEVVLAVRFEPLPQGSSGTIGGEYLRERGSYVARIPMFGPEPVGYSLHRHTRSLFGELRLQPKKQLQLVLSARRDWVSSLAPVTSRSLGLRYAWLNGRTALRANWSEGFKPPSFFALGHPLVGNPTLVPETSRTAEFGVDLQAGAAAMVRATAFATRHAQLIDFDSERFLNVNRGRVAADGLELATRLAATPRLTLQASHTRLQLRSDSGTPLRNRPDRRSSVHASLALFDRLRVAAHLIEVGRTHDFSIPTGEVTLPSYRRVDLALQQQWSAHLAFEAAVDNLFDKHHESFVGFPDPGIRLRIAVRATL